MAKKKEIVIFASGGGSNFVNLVERVLQRDINANIRCLITDRNCQAIERAKQFRISYYLLDRNNSETLNLNAMAILCHGVDLIVCAGYLSILNPNFVSLYKGKIINIHPSLLPKFGGKGMYGTHVHRAVLKSGDSETGCSVHYVDTGVDTGPLIEQSYVTVSALDTPESLQKKVLAEEHFLLPRVVEYLLR